MCVQESFPGHAGDSSFRTSPVCKYLVVLGAIIMGGTIIGLGAALAEVIRKQPLAASGCPDGWFRNRGKCYYFSKDELSWNDSQSFCLSCAASLAGIGRQQELDSELPYRGSLDHWIGLQRDTGGIWRWINGTKFDHPSEIQGGADCAYLDEDLNINSSGCSTQRKWVCSKPDTPQ